MSKAFTPIPYNDSEIKMTKRGQEIHNHLKNLEDELLINYAHSV